MIPSRERSHMGVSKNSGTPKWMVIRENSYSLCPYFKKQILSKQIPGRQALSSQSSDDPFKFEWISIEDKNALSLYSFLHCSDSLKIFFRQI